MCSDTNADNFGTSPVGKFKNGFEVTCVKRCPVRELWGSDTRVTFVMSGVDCI
jgi:hypothetical protein